MRVLCFLLLLNSFAFGGDLLDKLYAELTEKGETSFSHFEIALIAEGVADEATLKKEAAAWETFVNDRKVPEKKMRKSPKARLKEIQKNMRDVLKTPVDNEQGFVLMMDEGIYNRLTVTWLFVAAGDLADLTSPDYKPIMDKVLDPYFFTGEKPDAKALAAAYLVYQAYHLPIEQASDIHKMLMASNILVPQHSYEQETLGKLLYNKLLETHNKANELEKTDPTAAADLQVKAAQIAIGASNCYPKLDIYHAVNFNVGVKLITSKMEETNRDLVTELCVALSPHTGEYKADFDKNMGIRDYNYSANLFNAGEYHKAAAALEGIITPPDLAEYNRVLGNTYTMIIDQIWEKNKDEEDQAKRTANKAEMEGLMTKLAKVDPKQHEIMTQRLQQLELIELDKQGKLEEALEVAAKDTTTALNQKNYLSVIARFSQIKRENKNWDSAFEMLDDAKQEPWAKQTLTDLRFNTYVDWLDSYQEEDYLGQIKVYTKVFADPKMELSGKNLEVMRLNYGNALYRKVNKLVEDRKFKEAGAASAKALKAVPNHPELTKQSELIKRILDRIGG